MDNKEAIVILKNTAFLGTTVDVKKVKEAVRLAERAFAFMDYFADLYGQNLGIANWHLNGTLEPFDRFYEEALGYGDKIS